MFFVGMTRSILRAFMQWGLPNSLISFHSYFMKCNINRWFACRALQKVSKLVEMHLLQWRFALISIRNTHLDFCTASNVHKNILAVMLTSIG